MKNDLSHQVQGLMLKALAGTEFDEKLHPRDGVGRFSTSPGGGRGGERPLPSSKSPKVSFRQPGTIEQRTALARLLTVSLASGANADPDRDVFIHNLKSGKVTPDDISHLMKNSSFYRQRVQSIYSTVTKQDREARQALDNYKYLSDEGHALRDNVRAAANSAYRYGQKVDLVADQKYKEAKAKLDAFQEQWDNRDPEKFAELKSKAATSEASALSVTDALKGYNAFIRAGELGKKRAKVEEFVERKGGIPEEAKRFSKTAEAENHLKSLGMPRVEFGDMSPEVASVIATEMEELEREFPGLCKLGVMEISISGKGSIDRRMGKGRYAEMYTTAGVMRISGKFAKSYGVLLESLGNDSNAGGRAGTMKQNAEYYRKELAKGAAPNDEMAIFYKAQLEKYEKMVADEEALKRAAWHDGATDPRSVVVHEVGHRLHTMLGTPPAWPRVPEIDRFLHKYKDQAHQITGYAATNHREFLAEMFSVHKYGDEKTKNHPVMKEFSEHIYPAMKAGWAKMHAKPTA